MNEENIKNKDEHQDIKDRIILDNKKEKSKLKINFSSLLALVSYIGIGCIALALLFTLIFKGDTKLSDAFGAVGEVIAYIICIILAFSWVKNHKQVGWIVCYVVFVVTIVVLFILTI